MLGLKRQVEATLSDHQDTLAVARKELAAIARASALLAAVGIVTLLVSLLLLDEVRDLSVRGIRRG